MENHLKNYIPSNYIKQSIANTNSELGINSKYKNLLKESIYLFIHYLITYAEEISKEKNFSKITVFNLKEALIETDFQFLIDLIEENNLAKNIPVKRTLKQIK